VDITRRFSSLRQSLQDFHQPLHGLIRRLKEFLRPPNLPETKQFNAELERSKDAKLNISLRLLPLAPLR
jgi:hypothetical protein